MKIAKELGEKRKTFLKATAKELGISAQKLEKSIGKAIKKKAPKVKLKAASKPKKEKKKDENDEPEVEASSTTLARELLPPEKNTGRGGYYVNRPEVLEKHLKETKGMWRTRFPVSFILIINYF